MAFQTGTVKLFLAKRELLKRVQLRCAVPDLPETHLWLAVIDQAIFDAHLHQPGGHPQSTYWVAEAREFFNTKRFNNICHELGVNADWVRGLVKDFGEECKRVRGRDYDRATVAVFRRRRRRVARNERTWPVAGGCIQLAFGF